MLTGLLRYRKVEEVVAAKDEPTPVYLLDELVNITKTSPEDAQHVVEHLVKKLESKNPVVKAKSLRACKYLAEKGARDAVRIMQRTAAPIRQMQTYRGVTDSLKGDALNERVRTLAKETVAAIFNADTPSSQSSAPSRIQGFGSQTAPPPVGESIHMSSKMVGFGNEQYQASLREKSLASSARTYVQPSANFAQDRQTTSFLSDQPKVDVENGQNPVQSTGGYGSVLGDEDQLVDGICQPGKQFVCQIFQGPSSVVQGGVRPAPSTEDLRRFIDTAGSLSGPKIAIRLQKKLESPNWQECFRALCAIEMVILQGSSVSCGEIGVHFQSDLQIIRNCLKYPQRTVQDRAQRILNIFIEVDGHNDDDARNPVPNEDGPLLIDGVMEESHDNPPDVLDLLDGDVTSTDGQQQITPESSMFQGLDVISDVPPSPLPTAVGSADVTGGSQVSDMFSGLALSETSTPAKGSNVHLAALLAPSPASDPFPEAATPLKAEATTPLKAGATVPPQNQSVPYPSAPTAMMPPYGTPQMAYMGQVPMMQQYPQPGGMPFMNNPMQQPVMNQTSYGAAPVPQPYGNFMPTTLPPPMFPQRGQDGVNRGEVPLAAFLGPAHIERRNSSGASKSAFSFVGDHISQLREKK